MSSKTSQECFELPGMPDFMRAEDVVASTRTRAERRFGDLAFYCTYAAVQWGIVFLRTGQRQAHFGEISFARRSRRPDASPLAHWRRWRKAVTGIDSRYARTGRASRDGRRGDRGQLRRKGQEGKPVRIAVLVKQVPRAETMELLPAGRLKRDGVELEMNAYCRRAVSKGVELAPQSGGTCTVFTLGPPSAEDCLREAIAWGADTESS